MMTSYAVSARTGSYIVHTYVRMGYEYNANMTRLGAIQLNLNYDTYMNIVYTVEVSVTGKSGIPTSFFTVYLGYL